MKKSNSKQPDHLKNAISTLAKQGIAPSNLFLKKNYLKAKEILSDQEFEAIKDAAIDVAFE